MTQFLLIRHALNDTVGVRFAGRAPGVVLNEEGEQQAVKLAERLAGEPIKAIYSSPLERSIATAKPLAEKLGLKVETVNEFTELDLGEWTGKDFDEIRECSYFGVFNRFRSCTPAPDGESMLDAQSRMISGLLRLRSKHAGEMVAVVSHADTIKAAICYFTGMPIDMHHRLEIEPASTSVVELGTEHARILALNSLGRF